MSPWHREGSAQEEEPGSSRQSCSAPTGGVAAAKKKSNHPQFLGGPDSQGFSPVGPHGGPCGQQAFGLQAPWENYLLPLSGSQSPWVSSALEMGVQRNAGFPLLVGQATTLTLPVEISGHTSPQGTCRVTAPCSALGIQRVTKPPGPAFGVRTSDGLSVSQASSCLCGPVVSVMFNFLRPRGL